MAKPLTAFAVAYNGNFFQVFASKRAWDAVTPDEAVLFADRSQAKLHGEALLGGLLAADRDTAERLQVVQVVRRWVVQQ